MRVSIDSLFFDKKNFNRNFYNKKYMCEKLQKRRIFLSIYEKYIEEATESAWDGVCVYMLG